MHASDSDRPQPRGENPTQSILQGTEEGILQEKVKQTDFKPISHQELIEHLPLSFRVLARDGTRAALNPVVGQGDFKLIKTRQHTRSTEKKKPLMMIEDIKLFLKAMMIQDFNTMEAVGEWLRVTFEPRKYAPSGHFFKVGDEVKVRTAGGDWIRGEVVNATSSNTFDVEVGEVDENGEPLVDENGHRHAAFLDVLAHPKFMRHSKVSDVFTWNDDHQTYIRRSINVSVRPLFSFWRRLWHTHFKSFISQ
ncbi:hypothetical protein AAMO2058_000246500 [Amorphochlora amoebiformis]